MARKSRIKGMRGFKAKLNRMSKAQTRANKLRRETLEVGYKSAKDKVPVDTGELRDSIKKNPHDLTVRAKHAESVEYGTIKSPAKPYFRPAVDDMEEYLKKNIGGVIDDTK